MKADSPRQKKELARTRRHQDSYRVEGVKMFLEYAVKQSFRKRLRVALQILLKVGIKNEEK